MDRANLDSTLLNGPIKMLQCIFWLLFLVSEGPQSGGEDHERSGFQQGQRSRLQRVCCVGGRADGGVQ